MESTENSDYGKGLYNKFTVIRNDGSSEVGGKHHKCNYFVLDLTHDKFAGIALGEYARACQEEFPFLSAELFDLLGDLPFGMLPREYTKCPKCKEQLVFLFDNLNPGAQEEFFKKDILFQPAHCPYCSRTFYVMI